MSSSCDSGAISRWSSSSKSHEEACINDQVRRSRQKTEDLKEAKVRQAAHFRIDNDIDYTKEDAAAVDAAMLSLPTEFFGLHQVEQTGNFYYDADEISDYNKEAKERQHLKQSAILVNEWIQLLQQQQPRPQQLASPSFTVSTPSMTATGDAKAWKLGGQLSPSERKQMTDLLDLQKGNFAFSVEDLGGFKGEPRFP